MLLQEYWTIAVIFWKFCSVLSDCCWTASYNINCAHMMYRGKAWDFEVLHSVTFRPILKYLPDLLAVFSNYNLQKFFRFHSYLVTHLRISHRNRLINFFFFLETKVLTWNLAFNWQPCLLFTQWHPWSCNCRAPFIDHESWDCRSWLFFSLFIFTEDKRGMVAGKKSIRQEWKRSRRETAVVTLYFVCY